MQYLILLAAYLCLAHITENEERIAWNKNRKLTYSDFRGIPPLQKGDTVAEISPGIAVCPTDSGKILIYSFMVPKRSWVVVKTEETLRHEQVHFDIAEVYARLMRCEVSFYLKQDGDISDYRLDSIYKLYNQEFFKMENIYDSETDNSNIIAKQLEWQDKIALQLKNLSAWELPADTKYPDTDK